jgi:hypothetical protein
MQYCDSNQRSWLQSGKVKRRIPLGPGLPDPNESKLLQSKQQMMQPKQSYQRHRGKGKGENIPHTMVKREQKLPDMPLTMALQS